MNQCFIRVNHKNKRLRAFQRRLHEESEGQGEGRKGPHTRLPRSQASPNRGGCSSWPLSVFPFKDPRHYYSLREDGAAVSPPEKLPSTQSVKHQAVFPRARPEAATVQAATFYRRYGACAKTKPETSAMEHASPSPSGSAPSLIDSSFTQ